MTNLLYIILLVTRLLTKVINNLTQNIDLKNYFIASINDKVHSNGLFYTETVCNVDLTNHEISQLASQKHIFKSA